MPARARVVPDGSMIPDSAGEIVPDSAMFLDHIAMVPDGMV